LGIFDHIEKTSGSPSLERLYRERIAFVQRAEEAGFWGYHLAEHHCTPLSVVPSPGLFLSALATHTSTIHLGPMVFLLPFYNPLRLMLEICMLDNMSGGRFEFGVGRGVHPFEHAYYGIPTLQSSEIFEDALDVILKGFTRDQLNHKGPHFRYDGVPVSDMRPVQRPYPGLWYGAVKESSVIYAARRGMNICTNGPVEMNRRAIDVYRETRNKFWKSPDDLQPHIEDPKLGVQRFVFVGNDGTRAVETARQHYSVFLTNINRLYSYYGLTDQKVVIPFDIAQEKGVMIAGSADRVLEVLSDQVDRSGCNYLMLNFTFGSLSAAESRGSLDLFAERVMPHLQRAPQRLEAAGAR
jgi:alkanesulfonate monooxygenase SsuD/methylene tetrahydromethanopterin reductase-like flavin-dependent oxidoreductase (luciferase family)